MHLKHSHVYSNKVLVQLMNKMHAINLDIDGLCQILLCVQLFITPIKSLSTITSLYFFILTESLILLRRGEMMQSDVYFYSIYSFYND